MLPSTVARVPSQTDAEINARIRRQTEQNVARYKHAGPIAISRRLEELDAEWDTDLSSPIADCTEPSNVASR